MFHIALKKEYAKETEDLDSNTKGPYRTLLDIGIERKVDTLLEHSSLRVITAFVKSVLKPVVGAKIWNVNFGANKLISDFVTTSDEAFALLLLENNAAKWLELVEEPDLPNKHRKRAIYSQGGNGGPNWIDAGIDKFVMMQTRREKVRSMARDDPTSDHGKRFYAVERYIRAQLGSNDRKALARNKRKLEEIQRKIDGDKDPKVKQDKMRNMALLRATGIRIGASESELLVDNENTMLPVEVGEDIDNMDNIVTNQTAI